MGHANRPRQHHIVSLDAQPWRVCLSAFRCCQSNPDTDRLANSDSNGNTNRNRNSKRNTDCNGDAHSNSNSNSRETDTDTETSANAEASPLSGDFR